MVKQWFDIYQQKSMILYVVNHCLKGQYRENFHENFKDPILRNTDMQRSILKYIEHLQPHLIPPCSDFGYGGLLNSWVIKKQGEIRHIHKGGHKHEGGHKRGVGKRYNFLHRHTYPQTHIEIVIVPTL